MEAALMQALGAVAIELLKTWGLPTLPLMLSGLIWWLKDRRCTATIAEKDAAIAQRDATIEGLKTQIAAAQEKRIDEMRQMIQVAKTGTETMQARSIDDAKFHELFAILTDAVRELRDRLPAKPNRRRP